MTSPQLPAGTAGGMEPPMLRPGQGRIYDLGYQRYEGPREGRARALRALFRAGMRRAWGIGRPFRAKLAPWALFAMALVPALVGLGIAALVSEQFSPFRYDNYYSRWISRILLLFPAVVAPELVCPDLRQRVLTLYFSRALGRLDYVAGRLAALVAALLVVTLVPQTVLYIGNALAANDAWDYLGDQFDQVPRILGAGLLISLYFAAIPLAIAARTNRRVFAAGAIVAFMLISTAVVGAVHAVLENELSRWLALLAFSEVPGAATAWIFGTEPPGLAEAVDLPPLLWGLAAIAYTVVALLALAWRYVKLEP